MDNRLYNAGLAASFGLAALTTTTATAVYYRQGLRGLDLLAVTEASMFLSGIALWLGGLAITHASSYGSKAAVVNGLKFGVGVERSGAATVVASALTLLAGSLLKFG